MTLDDAEMRRAIARTLVVAVRATLAPNASPEVFAAARDAAQLLGLAGLDRALRACSEHAGRARPADVSAVVDRLRRLTEESETAGDIAVFERLDGEVGALADELAAYEWDVTTAHEDDETAAVPTLSVAQVLDDLVLSGEESRRLAGRLRLAATVAASLRAALDWLMPSRAGVRRVRIHGEPSLVEVRMDAVSASGLGPAHRVLSAVGGNLGPAIEPEGPEGGWVIRVPSFAPRTTYLMVVQGGIRLAVPWHSVLRLRMVAASDVRENVRNFDYPMLEFFATPSPQAVEYPLILVGHGLKRAWLVADRLIWRLMADPCENEWGSPSEGLTDTVCTDEGEAFWRADPARLLRRVDVPATPTRRGPSPAPSSVPTLGREDVEPEMAPPAFGEPDARTSPAIASDAAPVGRPIVTPLRPSPEAEPASATEATAHVAPPVLGLAPTLVPPPAPKPAVERSADEAAAAAATRPRALVAEDSLTGRIFLTRLLEQHGFDTEGVGSAAELLVRLVEDRWNVVLVDVDLPDDHGAAWLKRVRQAASAVSPGAAVVALVRDDADTRSARDAGVGDVLEKPFERAPLLALLSRLGFARTGS